MVAYPSRLGRDTGRTNRLQDAPKSAVLTVKAPTIEDAAVRGDYLTMSSDSGPFQKGESIQKMQDALRAKGHDITDEKGVMGKSTSDAMWAFQRAEKQKDPQFKVDGLAGPQTLGALGLHSGGQDTNRATARQAVGGQTYLPSTSGKTPGGLTAGQLANAANARRAGKGTKQAIQMVAPKRTPMKGEDAASALRTAWTNRFGTPPSERTVAILTAQWAHETANGKKMNNYNFGGIKGTGPSGLSASYKTREGWGATEIKITDRFRAYTGPEEGASDYISLLARRYPEATNAAAMGDATGFVSGLKQRRYFTGNEVAYTKRVNQLAQTAMTRGYNAIG